jgi:hypothetical protein
MRILAIFFLVFFLITNIAYADSLDQLEGLQEYEGTIDGNLKITLLLERKGGQLKGEYRYNSQQAMLDLKGEMIGEKEFILREFDGIKETGVFRGAFLNDGRVEGQWSNPEKTAQYEFRLERKAPTAWTGKWSRTKDYFSPATLKIWNVSETGFDFKLSAASGGHTGMIGFFDQGSARAQFIEGYAVYKTKEGILKFYLRDDKLIVEQKGNIDAGMGVVYLGEYQKGEVVLVPPTLVEHNVFHDSSEEIAFKALVGDYYRSFLASFHLVYEEKDLDQVGASVYRGGVRGLFTCMEGIIMRTSDGEMWAGVIQGDKVRYFTNSKRFNGLPLTIENWRSGFKNKEVITVYNP